jgi:hypothetical protein
VEEGVHIQCKLSKAFKINTWPQEAFQEEKLFPQKEEEGEPKKLD